MTYPALSIKQPWAWLICHGFKDVENRSWATRYRGTLLIHAGATFDDGFDWEYWSAVLARNHDAVLPAREEAYARGGIVGRAELIGCFKRGERTGVTRPGFIEDSAWYFGPVGWLLRGAVARDLRPCRGRLGLFRPEYGNGGRR